MDYNKFKGYKFFFFMSLKLYLKSIFKPGGVDTFDHCIAINSCRRKTNRWPSNVFMFMIDAAAQNAFALYKLQNNIAIDFLRTRKIQLEKLGLDLINHNPSMIDQIWSTFFCTSISVLHTHSIRRLKDVLKINQLKNN